MEGTSKSTTNHLRATPNKRGTIRKRQQLIRPLHLVTSSYLLILLLFQSLSSTKAQCSLCVDGSNPPDIDFRIDGSSCVEFASQISAEGNPTTCAALQVTFGVYCGCDNPILDTTCRVCGNDLLPDPSFPITTLQTSFDQETCLGLEFEANLNPNTDSGLSCETVQFSEVADACCAASTRPTRSPSSPTTEPTLPPTKRPTALPTRGPTHTPTHMPTSMPVEAPTETPIMSPTQGPSAIPIQSPTKTPTVEGSPTVIGQTPAPTTAVSTVLPTLLPTKAPTVPVVANFRGITLKLPGVGELDENAQNNFESALQGWYYSLYEPEFRLRSRSLQQQRPSLRRFQTRVLYKSQDVDESDGTTTVVNYDQTVSYIRSVNEDPVDLRKILSDPFSDEAALLRLMERLRVSDPFFEAIDGSLEAPDVPEPTRMDDDDGSNGLGVGAIIGIVVGGLVAFGLAVFLLMKVSSKKATEEQEEQQTTVIKQAVEDKPPEEPSDERHPEAEEEEDDIQHVFSTEPTPAAKSALHTSDSEVQTTGTADEESVPTKPDYESKRVRSPRPGPDVDDTPSLSSGVGTRSQKTSATCDTSSWMGVLGLESSANDNTSHTGAPAQLTYEVIVPPGKLGVVIDTPSEGPPEVFAVKDSSPLHGKVQVGDSLVQVDDEDVSTFSAVKVSKLIGQKAKNPERKFVLCRTLPTVQHGTDS